MIKLVQNYIIPIKFLSEKTTKFLYIFTHVCTWVGILQNCVKFAACEFPLFNNA